MNEFIAEKPKRWWVARDSSRWVVRQHSQERKYEGQHGGLGSEKSRAPSKLLDGERELNGLQLQWLARGRVGAKGDGDRGSAGGRKQSERKVSLEWRKVQRNYHQSDTAK
jgi:hypothetical protein